MNGKLLFISTIVISMISTVAMVDASAHPPPSTRAQSDIELTRAGARPPTQAADSALGPGLTYWSAAAAAPARHVQVACSPCQA